MAHMEDHVTTVSTRANEGAIIAAVKENRGETHAISHENCDFPNEASSSATWQPTAAIILFVERITVYRFVSTKYIVGPTNTRGE
jgi:hypothetical protein